MEEWIFGHHTQEALLTLQAMKGLPETGVCDMKTWEVLLGPGFRPVTKDDMPFEVRDSVDDDLEADAADVSPPFPTYWQLIDPVKPLPIPTDPKGRSFDMRNAEPHLNLFGRCSTGICRRGRSRRPVCLPQGDREGRRGKDQRQQARE